MKKDDPAEDTRMMCDDCGGMFNSGYAASKKSTLADGTPVFPGTHCSFFCNTCHNKWVSQTTKVEARDLGNFITNNEMSWTPNDIEVEELAAVITELQDRAITCGVALGEPARVRLPIERPGKTHYFVILANEGGVPVRVKCYLTANNYPDGSLGEIFVRIEKPGYPVNGFVDAWCISVSMMRQVGVPLATIVGKFKSMRYEPSGRIEGGSTLALSPIDYICRWLEKEYLS